LITALGSGIASTTSTPRSSPSDRRWLFASQVRSTVVRISVPARTALVTGVFSAISASLARWSSPSGPRRLICRSIHRVARS
jgi:hypothetical protein